MVNVTFIKKDSHYINLEINGHALFESHGKDIVCAGISSIVFGALNAFDQLEKNVEVSIDDKKNIIALTVTKPNQNTNLLFSFVLIQLKTIELNYKENIRIMEVK